jgi:hypothetical protein
MRRKTWIIALVIVILAAAAGGGLYWHWSNSPRYALQQAALALKTRNMDTFFKYVNLKEIVLNFSRACSRDLQAQNDKHPNDLTKYCRRLGGKFAQVFLPKLLESFEPQVRQVVEHYLLKLNNTQILEIAAAVTVAHIDTQGDTAQVTLTDPKTQEKLHFQMHRQANRGTWQIVSVNYDDLKTLYKRVSH